MTTHARSIAVDTEVGTAYVTLSDADVSSTVEVTETVLADLDEFGVTIGVEVLNLSVPLPLTELTKKVHVRPDDEAYLGRATGTLLQAGRSQFHMTSATDSTINGRTTPQYPVRLVAA